MNPEATAIQKNKGKVVALVAAGVVDMNVFGQSLADAGFMESSAVSGIMGTLGLSPNEKVGRMMSAVIEFVKVDAGMFQAFRDILERSGPLERLLQMIDEDYAAAKAKPKPAEVSLTDKYQVTGKRLDEMLTDDHINSVSLFLVRWLDVANQLKVNPLDIDELQGAHLTPTARNHRMLTTWKAAVYRGATFRKLVQALDSLEAMGCADKVCELIR